MKLIFLFILTLPLSALDLSVNANSAILMDAQTGRVLWEKGAMEQTYPASITKILTTLITLENKEEVLSETVVAPRDCLGSITPTEKIRANYKHPSHWIEIGSSHVGIKVGEELSMEALLHAIMLESGNDASNIVAHHIAGDIPTFVAAMNIRAEQLGCKKTHFTNPHGLHHPEHVTCAYDMALMTKAALAHPRFRHLAKTTHWKKGASNKQEAVTWVQHNQLVKPGKKHYYPKAIGVKTGRTDDAGTTLVAAAEDKGRELIAVVLGCKDFPHAYADVTRLFEAAFNEAKVQHCLVRRGPQPYTVPVPGGSKSLATYTERDAMIEYLPSYRPDARVHLSWFAVEAPICAGEQVGEVQVVTEEGQLLTSVPLLAEKGVSERFKLSDIATLSEKAKGALVASCALIFIGLALVQRR